MGQPTEKQPRNVAGAFLLLAASLFLWGALLTNDAGDWPSRDQFPHNEPTQNACGTVGAFVAYHVRLLIGDGVYPLALFATCAGVLHLTRGRIGRRWQRAIGLALLIASTSATVQLVATPGPDSPVFGDGGALGAVLGRWLKHSLSGLGTTLVIGYAFVVGVLFAAEGWVLHVPATLVKVSDAVAHFFKWLRNRSVKKVPGVGTRSALVAVAPSGVGQPVQPDEEAGPPPRINRPPAPPAELSEAVAPAVRPPRADEVSTEPPGAKGKRRGAGKHAKQRAKIRALQRAGRRRRRSQTGPAAKDIHSPPPHRVPIQSMETEPEVIAEAYPSKLSDWRFPPLSLLTDQEHTFTAAQESVLRSKAKTLERTLTDFRLNARVVEIDTGPVITLFELELGGGIKVSRISSLANDIARALRAPSVRIIAPIPGKNTVGVEVPNLDKERVRLKSLFFAAEAKMDSMSIPLFLGKDASGRPLVQDLAAMPHLLIAGTTGSGKSVCINSIVMSILMSRRPDETKLVLIDPKMVELSHFKDVPHLMAPIITETKRAERVLDWAVTKMDERYALLAEARVRNITGYNSLGADELYDRLQPTSDAEKRAIPQTMPHIVIIIDELADLMMTSAKEVEHHLSRLAQKSRAVGIHIVVATQRPEARVVTGLIKSNLPCRCAFRVASRLDSRIVLDQNGAEVLMGQGDMLFLPPGSHKVIRAQGTFVDDHELHQVLGFLTAQGSPQMHPELVRMRMQDDVPAAERDPLFDKAVEVVLETERGSVSLLQRRLTIGYSRASRLIEQMAAAGIVGEYKGSQAREVLLTPQRWEAMQEAMADDMAGQLGQGEVVAVSEDMNGATMLEAVDQDTTSRLMGVETADDSSEVACARESDEDWEEGEDLDDDDDDEFEDDDLDEDFDDDDDDDDADDDFDDDFEDRIKPKP